MTSRYLIGRHSNDVNVLAIGYWHRVKSGSVMLTPEQIATKEREEKRKWEDRNRQTMDNLFGDAPGYRDPLDPQYKSFLYKSWDPDYETSRHTKERIGFSWPRFRLKSENRKITSSSKKRRGVLSYLILIGMLFCGLSLYWLYGLTDPSIPFWNQMNSLVPDETRRTACEAVRSASSANGQPIYARGCAFGRQPYPNYPAAGQGWYRYYDENQRYRDKRPRPRSQGNWYNCHC